MQGWTPLHVALFPKTHIKDLVDWSWLTTYQEDLRKQSIDYSVVSQQMISCIQVTCQIASTELYHVEALCEPSVHCMYPSWSNLSFWPS